MIAASFWSLLAPSIALAEDMGMIPWLPAGVGFLLGGALLVIAITLHNIPEGLAIGVSFGAAAAGMPDATLGAALALAIGIGLQNFPEGTAISLPLGAEGLSRARLVVRPAVGSG
jgi:ZIP family zinc transporter